MYKVDAYRMRYENDIIDRKKSNDYYTDLVSTVFNTMFTR